jgi:hypothetical protein
MLKTFVCLLSRIIKSSIKSPGFSDKKFQHISNNIYKAIICSAKKNSYLLKTCRAISNAILKTRDLFWQYTTVHHKMTFIYKDKNKNITKSEQILKINEIRMKF